MLQPCFFTSTSGLMDVPTPSVEPAILAATRVYDINELLHEVVQYADRPTLATLARTSQVLFETATRLLWEQLDSASPLESLVSPVSFICSLICSPSALMLHAFVFV